MAKYPLPIFAENSLDRMGHLRSSIHDHAGPAIFRDNRYILMFTDEIVLRRNDKKFMFSEADIVEISHDKKQAVFLGGKEHERYFALCAIGGIGPNFENMNVRAFVTDGLLQDADMGLVAQAASVLKWHETHGFCSYCGSRTDMANGGWRRDCPSCGKQHFPRVDPVVIMLVTHQGHCLLGTGRDFKIAQRYSCLAGFMEPGETVEDAARRELFEEAGITANRVEYAFSQPWPFPSNLMLGMHLEAESMETTIDKTELVDLKWVSKADVEAVLNGATDRGFSLPPRIAIARNLLEAWVSPSGNALSEESPDIDLTRRTL